MEAEEKADGRTVRDLIRNSFTWALVGGADGWQVFVDVSNATLLAMPTSAIREELDQ